MEIVKFSREHIKEAKQIARENYYEECEKVHILPQIEEMPDLKDFADNGLGVAAFEGKQMIGFLCCHSPWENAFDSLAVGTFSPIHAHGAIKNDREKIYMKMYEKAAQVWVKHKIGYHGITLYAHDEAAIRAFFAYGFGLRCIDAMRMTTCIEVEDSKDIIFEELAFDEMIKVRALRKLLSTHFGKSPCFMYESDECFNESVVQREKSNHRVFVAKDGDKTIAFIEIADEGENFVTEVSDVKNICGAFCLSEYRGKNITQNLINFVMKQLQKEGYSRLGVDFESFNPTAQAFWKKHFEVYTNSLVRRIDECAFKA